VWEEHLLPLLTCQEAARLGCTCKALRVVVRECFVGELVREDASGDEAPMGYETLRAAMTTFPRAREVAFQSGWDLEEWKEEALLQWLREGGRGGHLAKVWFKDEAASYVVHTALQQGVLPSLKGLNVTLFYDGARASLTGGFLRGMHELRVSLRRHDQAQLAALGLVRQLPPLTDLEVMVYEDHDDSPVHWPPFIPPSLKTLTIKLSNGDILLHALPGMLGASGARLERLEITLPDDFEAIGDGLVHVAQALRCCSSSLKGFFLGEASGWDKLGTDLDPRSELYTTQVARLHAQWVELLAGASACRELQMLELPLIVIEPLFPPGTAFAHLIHLEIADHKQERGPAAGVMGLWELMASGGLPALARLSVRVEGQWMESHKIGRRVAPALEAVAGTLTHFCLVRFQHKGPCLSEDRRMAYDLGAAVGKLRRLRDLALDLSRDAQVYREFAAGLAASGGDHPLPLLWRVKIFELQPVNAQMVTSLLRPSVRVLFLHFDAEGSFCGQDISRAAVALACALRQAEYEHSLELDWDTEEGVEDIVRAIAPCTIPDLIDEASLGWPVLSLL
jgi:hypothetical protein